MNGRNAKTACDVHGIHWTCWPRKFTGQHGCVILLAQFPSLSAIVSIGLTTATGPEGVVHLFKIFAGVCLMRSYAPSVAHFSKILPVNGNNGVFWSIFFELTRVRICAGRTAHVHCSLRRFYTTTVHLQSTCYVQQGTVESVGPR